MSEEDRAQMPTVSELVRFNSVTDFIEYLDKEIGELRGKLGELLRRLESTKAKAMLINKFESLVSELAKSAGQQAGPAGTWEINLGLTRVVVNPTPKQELDALVAVVKSYQERVVMLERLKKNLEPLTKLSEIEIGIEVVFENMIPTMIFIKM